MAKKWIFGAVMAGALAVAMVGFSPVAPAWAAGGPSGRGPVDTWPGVGSPNPGLALPAATDLSADEAAGLLWMYAEEQLARDVYTALSAKWGTAVFSRIAQSEQTHMDAVQGLLDRYLLDVPANPAGVFSDPTLQALYTDLVARGSESLTAARQVGVDIETMDIADLDERLAQTDNADIQQVYTNLRSGSTNHLCAFSGTGGSPTAPGRTGQRGNHP